MGGQPGYGRARRRSLLGVRPTHTLAFRSHSTAAWGTFEGGTSYSSVALLRYGVTGLGWVAVG